jgi:hypothetical protein
MAAAPFATSGNVADIAPVQLKGGFTPDTGLADAVVNVANTVIPVIQQNLEDDLTNDVTGKARSVSLALKVHRFPSLAEKEFSEEALGDPNVRLALDNFFEIQEAVKQNKLPSNFALERLELIQNNAIRNAPAFEAEIRAAMRDATGVDPQKALFGRLLSETTQKTAEQKAFEQLDVESIKLGITRDQLINMNQVAALNKIEQNKFDLAAKQGTYTLNTSRSEIINRGAGLMTDTMAIVQRLATAGQAIGVEEKQALVAQVNASFGAATSAILAKTTGLNVSGTAINAELTPLNALRDNVIKMIEDDTLQSMLSQHNETIIADAQNTFLNNAEYGPLYAVLGHEGTLKFMEFKTKYGKNPEALALAKVFNKDAAAISDVDEILKQATIVGNGEALETAAQINARVVAAGHGVSNSAAGEEYQMKSLEDITLYRNTELTWSGFNSNSWLSATGKSNRLKAAFINMQATTTAGLSQDLVLLAGNPDVQMERLVLDNSGSLSVTPRTQIERTGLAQTALAADTAMATYARRFNRANGISAKYNGAGILPSSRYQGSEAYWGTVKEAAGNLVQPREEEDVKVIKFIRDADGNLVLATEGE